MHRLQIILDFIIELLLYIYIDDKDKNTNKANGEYVSIWKLWKNGKNYTYILKV